MLKMKKFDFAAEVGHVAAKTRFGDSFFWCKILQGEIQKGDVVQLLNADGGFIAEQEIKNISYAREFQEKAQKGVPEDDKIDLTFKRIWEYPIQATKYIVKMDEHTLSEYKQKPKIKLPINNDLPYQQLITQTVDIDEFIKKFYIYPCSLILGYYLGDIYRGIGIECLRETELGALYSVHKVCQGGLLYIFYRRIDYSGYVKVAGWYYVQSKRSKSDFSSIKKGSTLSDVIAIDPAAQIYEKIYNNSGQTYIFNMKGIGLDTYHFLSDGVMKLHFNYTELTEGEGKQLRVTKKKIADFDDIRSAQPGEQIYSIHGRILPMDMID